MTISFTADAERRIQGSHEDLRVAVALDGTITVMSLDGTGRSPFSITMTLAELQDITQFATRAIKAMETAKAEVEGG